MEMENKNHKNGLVKQSLLEKRTKDCVTDTVTVAEQPTRLHTVEEIRKNSKASCETLALMESKEDQIRASE